MDPNTMVLEISSDEDADCNWLTSLLGGENTEVSGDDSDEVVVVVSESGKPVKKPELKYSFVDFVDDDDDDCVVLENDPNAPADVRNDGSGDSDDDDDSDDVVVVSEKGQVACRDYPHSRHLCIKFPFLSTPNQSHCNQCYCYVCDSLAPCIYWGNGSASSDHCHATDKDEFWILERKNAKNGDKAFQPISQPPLVDSYTPAPVTFQYPNQIPKSAPIHANRISANFQSPNIMNQYRNNILAARNKLHPPFYNSYRGNLGNPIRQQRYSVGSRVPVFKRTGPVWAATTANRHPHIPYRGNLGNPIRPQNYQTYLGSLQPNTGNAYGPYPPQSQTYTSPTVNQPQPQFSNHSNPNFQSPVNNSNPIPENLLYQQLHDVPPSSGQQTYTAQVQPSYHVPSKTQVDSPLVPVSDFTQNSSQEDSPLVPVSNQSQGPIVDSGFKDSGLGLPMGQDSATLEGAGFATNELSLGVVSGGLADYRFDWIFDNQPIEPGFTDYSSDSAFIDTGPIFEF